MSTIIYEYCNLVVKSDFCITKNKTSGDIFVEKGIS